MSSVTHLAGSLGVEAPVAVEGGREVRPGEVMVLNAGDAGLDDKAGVPQPGALVHVLVQPLIANGEVEVLDQDGELAVGGAEEGDDPLQELGGHEGVGGEAAVEVVEAPGQEVVEAIDGAGRRVHISWIGEVGAESREEEEAAV